jgi:hypothetical protein
VRARETIAYIRGMLDARTSLEAADRQVYDAIVAALAALAEQIEENERRAEDQQEHLEELAGEIAELREDLDEVVNPSTVRNGGLPGPSAVPTRRTIPFRRRSPSTGKKTRMKISLTSTNPVCACTAATCSSSLPMPTRTRRNFSVPSAVVCSRCGSRAVLNGNRDRHGGEVRIRWSRKTGSTSISKRTLFRRTRCRRMSHPRSSVLRPTVRIVSRRK